MGISQPAGYRHLTLHPPDVAVLSTPSGSEGYGQIIEELHRRSLDGPYYLIVDFGELKAGNVSKADREAAQSALDPSWFLGGVYINASMPVRMMIKVLTLAMFLVGRADYPTEYVSSVEEAFDVVERFRRERANRG